MSKLRNSEKAIDAINAEIADTQKELELIHAKVRDREADRNALALSKGDPRAVADFYRAGKEIGELQEQIAFRERLLQILSGQVQAAQQAKNTVLADRFTEQAQVLLEQFEKVRSWTVQTIACIMADDHKELREIRNTIEKIADKWRKLCPGVQRLRVPQLACPAAKYICRVCREITNGTIKP